MKKDWYKQNINISHLLINFQYINEVEADAFLSIAFQATKSLVIYGSILPEYVSGMFNGLESLEFLQIVIIGPVNFSNDILEPVKNTLKKLYITTFYQHQFPLINVIGNVELPYLTDVNLIRNNFASTITNNTFLGLIAVENLTLSICNIMSFGEGSFDSIAKTIKYLDLRENKFITLPPFIFDDILEYNNVISIYMAGNRLSCDCELQILQNRILSCLNKFDETIICDEPGPNEDITYIDLSACDGDIKYLNSECNAVPPSNTTTITTSTEEIINNTIESVTELTTPSISITIFSFNILKNVSQYCLTFIAIFYFFIKF